MMLFADIELIEFQILTSLTSIYLEIQNLKDVAVVAKPEWIETRSLRPQIFCKLQTKKYLRNEIH